MWIQVGNRKLTFEEIATKLPQSENPLEKKIFAFCHDWLNGKADYTFNTSGSTGKPKQVHFERAQLEHSARQTETALGLRKGFHCLLCLDCEFIAGQMMLVRCMVTQMNLTAVVPSSNPFPAIPKSPPLDFASFVPLQVEQVLASSSAHRLDELKVALIGGAPISDQLSRKIKKFKGDWYATYGMTETLSHVALQKISDPDASDCFKTLHGIRIDQDSRSCLSIQADYLGRDKIITNDLVKIVSAGQFKWLGRFDNVINSGGRKVIPEELEKIVSTIFNNKQISNRFFIGAMPSEKLGQEIVLVIEGKDFDHQLKTDLEIQFGEVLTRFDVPRQIYFVETFATTQSGKIDRKRTINLLLARPERP